MQKHLASAVGFMFVRDEPEEDLGSIELRLIAESKPGSQVSIVICRALIRGRGRCHGALLRSSAAGSG